MKCAGDISSKERRFSVVLFRWSVALLGCAALFGLILSRVQAQLHDVMLQLGANAMAFPGSESSEPRTLAINGIAVFFRTQVVDASLADTIGHYQDLCAKGGLTQEWYGTLLSSLGMRSATNENDGYVACVQIDSWSFSSLSARIARFVDTWDIADLGSPRYVYASRADERPSERTFVLTMWTEGPTSLRNLLPIGGEDAPGADPVGVRRPRGSQRILSATEVSEHAGVFSYLVRDQAPRDVERDYRQDLSKGGWRILERSERQDLDIDGILILSAESGQRLLTVIAHRSARGGTAVTLLDWKGV